jgi:hypothetical protein
MTAGRLVGIGVRLLIAAAIGWFVWSGLSGPSYDDDPTCTPTGFLGAEECE